MVITNHSQSDEALVYCNVASDYLPAIQKRDIGHNCRFLQGDDRQDKPLTKIWKAIGQGTYRRVLIRNYKKSGKMFWNELIISPIRENL